MTAMSAPSAGVEPEPIYVSELIEAANEHLARYGDTPVNVAIGTPTAQFLLRRAATMVSTHYHCDDEHETVLFEVEARGELDTP